MICTHCGGAGGEEGHIGHGLCQACFDSALNGLEMVVAAAPTAELAAHALLAGTWALGVVDEGWVLRVIGGEE